MESLNFQAQVQPYRKMVILVRVLTGKLVRIQTYPEQQVTQFMLKIQSKQGIPPDQFKLIRVNEEVTFLKQDQTIKETGVRNMETIELLLIYEVMLRKQPLNIDMKMLHNNRMMVQQ